MSPARHGSQRSLVIKGLGLVAVLTMIWCIGVGPAHASECYFAENITFTYYSSAAHTQIVGRCSQGPCLGAGCYGTTSQYVVVSESGICEVCVE
jgi:hypothetical protein